MLSNGTSRTLIEDVLYGARVTVRRSSIAVIVLAAGAGTRFSGVPGSKLVAHLGGRPVLEHVLAAVRAFGPRLTIVVIGSGREAVERTIQWAGETRVVNPDPRRGIGSSIRVGFEALAADESLGAESAIGGTFIVLGDQPQLRPEVLEALADHAAAADEGPAIIVPRYADDPGPRNPVLLLRAAWPLLEDLVGDQGLGPLIADRPDFVEEVLVSGVMPDVDEPRDLVTLEGERG
jgi:CTP:molybdopterin cytidylyltransferase MocA